MDTRKRNHPDFWGREGRGGEEWDAVDREKERGNELGDQGFERPAPNRPTDRSPTIDNRGQDADAERPR
jgi:hypothetical protein